MDEHQCFEVLVDQTGMDATFEKRLQVDYSSGEMHPEWVINLYKYTPGLRISQNRSALIPNYCPMCGKCLAEAD